VAEDARRSIPVRRSGDLAAELTDQVAVEEPLQIRVAFGSAGEPPEDLLVTMRTPGADAELVRGFLYAEGLLDRAADVLGESRDDPPGNVLTLSLDAALRPRFANRRRDFYATAACGVCGKASIEALQRRVRHPGGSSGWSIATPALAALPEALLARQPAFARTGGMHAAALFDCDGAISAVREDVGRHNAVDKLVGAALLAGTLPLIRSGLFVSGRVSFEIIEKASMAGCPLVASVGAPTSLAVDAAWEAGVTLVGFVRGGRFNIYSLPARITPGS